MKVTRIKSLCKDAHQCIIYEHMDRQYIGTTSAIYPADNMQLDKLSICTLFDMSDAVQALRVERRMLEESDIMPETFDFAGVCGTERQLRESIVINYLGDTLLGLVDDAAGMLLFVEMDYIRAAEKTEGYLIYHLAENKKGEPLVILSDGMIVTGVVKPIPKKTANSARGLLWALGSTSAIGSPDAGVAEEQPAEQLPGQMDMQEMLEEEGE